MFRDSRKGCMLEMRLVQALSDITANWLSTLMASCASGDIVSSCVWVCGRQHPWSYHETR